MKVAVTGAHGFVGLNVVRTLAESGETVYAVGRRPLDSWVARYLEPVASQVQHRRADLAERGQLAQALTGDEVDAVVHAAVVTATTPQVERDESAWIVAVNTLGTLEALELAREKGSRRFVYISSPSAIGPAPRDLPMTEEVRLQPDTLYGITKMASEAIVRRYGQIHALETASVRIAQPYGPGERATPSRVRTSPIYEWLRDVDAGRPLPTGPLDRARDWTYVDETANGIALLVTTPELPHDLYHLGAGNQITIAEVIATLRLAYPDLSVDEQPEPDALNPNIAGPSRQPLDTIRFREDFGWSPETGIAEGMDRYLEWWRGFRP